MGCATSATIRCLSGEQESFHQKYKLGEKLGEGNFGQVRVAKLRRPKAIRAAKIICLSGSGSKTSGEVDRRRLQDAEAEAEVMRLLEGLPDCVQLYETFTEGSLFYMVMEKCERSLIDCLDRMSSASEDYVAPLFRDMMLGISHVHEVGLVHCDIKPNNFLLGGPKGQTVKLADFGMTCKMPNRGYLTSHCGTAPYMSPEVVARKPYNFKTDVWSMGVTAYVLLYGDFPYLPKVFTPQAMKEQILHGVPAPEFAPASRTAVAPSERAQCFVRALMERDQADRCTADEALWLPFVCPDVPPPPDQADDLTPSFRRARLKTCEIQQDLAASSGLDSVLSVLQAHSQPLGHSHKSVWMSEHTDSTHSSIQSSHSDRNALACDTCSSEESVEKCRF